MASAITQDDPEVQLGLLEGINCAVQAFLKCLECNEGQTFTVLGVDVIAHTSGIPKDLLSETCNLCVNKLLEVMATKTLETIIVRKVLEVIHFVCLIWDDLRHLNSIFNFLAKNMNQDVIGRALSIKKQLSTLQILSNDIPSHTPNLDDIQEEALHNDIDSDSDQDNWDDEGDADVQINIAEIVNFLTKLKTGFSM